MVENIIPPMREDNFLSMAKKHTPEELAIIMAIMHKGFYFSQLLAHVANDTYGEELKKKTILFNGPEVAREGF